ncbi:major facilitator superfamily domain-containing protein [Xylogone sp. PMI_703]|nr:major facilitator superfamily domain-containing protein [Xylogone sp. PMI_703]
MEREEKDAFDGLQTEGTRPSVDENLSSTPVIRPEGEIPSTGSLDNDKTKATAGDDYLTGLKLVVVLAAVTMAAFLMILDLSVVVTAIPKITTHFHSTADIGWYGSAYLLANCSLQPLSGKIYTHFNSKFVFLTFLGLFELGSLLCGVSTSSKMLIVGRAVAGMGGSGLVNGALTILSSAVPLVRRPLMLGILMGVANIANALGPFIGGSLTQYASWRWCFFINLPCGAVVAGVLFIIHIPQSAKPEARLATFGQIFHTLDVVGFIIFAPAIIMFLLALSWGGTAGHPWDSATIIGLFVGSAPVFAIFLAWEYYRGATALVPLAIFRQRVVAAATLVQFFTMGAVMVTVYYMPVWFQAVRGKSPTTAGAFLLPMVGAQILTAVVGGALISRVGYYTPFGALGLGIGAIGTGLLTILLPNSSTGDWVGFEFLAGIRGMALQVPLVAVQNHLSKENVAIGTSMLVFMQNFGGTLMLSFAELIFTQVLENRMRVYAPNISAADILAWGATGFREHIPRDNLPGVLLAYDKAITTTLYLAVGTMVAAWCFAWGLGWKNIKTKEKGKEVVSEGAIVGDT